LKKAAVNETVAFFCFRSVFWANGAAIAPTVPRTVPQSIGPARGNRRRRKARVWLRLASKAAVFTWDGGTGSHWQRFHVSVLVPYTCRRAVRWPSGRRRRFA